MIISDDDFEKAIDRFSRTADGRVVYCWLQNVLCDVITTSEDGALRENNGERRFAAKLMGHMAKGIEESGGRDNQPIVFNKRHAGAVSGRVSPRDYFRKQLTDEPAGE